MKLNLRPNAQLVTDFPDDTIEDDRDIIVFGGRGVAEALAEKFRALGYPVTDPEYAGDHGWDFFVPIDKRHIVFQVTDFADGRYLLMCFDAGKSARADPLRAKLLIELDQALARDQRFKAVNWHLDPDPTGEFSGPSSPVDEADRPMVMQNPKAPSSDARQATARHSGRAGFLHRLLASFWRR